MSTRLTRLTALFPPFSVLAAPAPAPTLDYPEIRKAVVSRLLGVTTIAELIGTAVYPLRVPQTASYPCLCYGLISNVRGHRLSGASGIAFARVQLEARSKTYQDVLTLKAAVEAAFDGFTGTVAGVQILAAWQLDDHDDFQWPKDGSDAGLFRVIFDYRFKYRVLIPTF